MRPIDKEIHEFFKEVEFRFDDIMTEIELLQPDKCMTCVKNQLIKFIKEYGVTK